MVRAYHPGPVPDLPARLERIVAAGSRAPSAGNTQGQAFVVVTDPERRHRIAVLAGEDAHRARGLAPWLSSAAALVVVCTSELAYRTRYAEADKARSTLAGEGGWEVPYWWVDAGAALMAVLLATVDEGLAAGFLGAHAIPGLKVELELPGSVTPVGVVTIGLPAPDRRSVSLDHPPPGRRVHLETWTRGSGWGDDDCDGE
jgi:nitroreductase